MMDARELAIAMLEWEQLMREINAVAVQIKVAVLELRKTQKVGYTHASYSEGRKNYNYQKAAQDVSPSTIRAHTTTKEYIDWPGICKAEEITEIPFTQSAPKVTLKLLA